MFTNQSEPDNEYSGAEPFLVGLSPQYWAHCPLTIRDVHNLCVVDGIDCMIVKSVPSESTWQDREGYVAPTQSVTQNRSISTDREATKQEKDLDEKCDSDGDHVKFLPVSKCHVEGVVVNVERKSNGSVLYLVDDGTGLIDCLCWEDDELYSLPPLVQPLSDEIEKTGFRVGDCIRVLGKIRCMAIGDIRETVSVAGKVYDVRYGIREIQTTIIEHATPNGMRHQNMLLDLESKHWLDCIQFRKKVATPIKKETRSRDDHDTVYNGAETLGLLGPEIGATVAERSDFPSSNDALGAWRVFGTNCQCTLPYKESLLYCHCQATVETLDPHFTFRDAVLDTLVRMEDDKPVERSATPSPLRFQYKQLVQDQKLAALAERVVATTGNPSVQAKRLYICTFRALRKDGIIHLVDRDTDTYLLVSRERVLEPYIEKISSKDTSLALERQMLKSRRPAYLNNVPSARLQHVKKCLMDKAKN